MKKSMLDVMKTGRKYETEHFIFYVKQAENLKIGFRLGGDFGGAVARNRIKRITRNLIRKHFKTGDFVVRAKNVNKALSSEEIVEEWNSIVKRIL
ncbi:MAG TPA: ribonuclease P protein component [bacterium]|nr:ribonuclease P protein component [bacterium]HPO52861.1 ribonuclease P protein component [bacterium]